jgi:2-iminoacetate synthase
MFSQIFDTLDARARRILNGTVCPSPDRTRDLLDKGSREVLELNEVAELLEIGADSGADTQFGMLREFTVRRFRKASGNRVRYIAPIYISSYCVDACPYCNFSANRRNAHRIRLNLADYERELDAVMASGARAIEIVLATDPELPWQSLTQYVARAAKALKGEAGSGVLLCSEYLPAEAYAALHEAGLWGMVQWDETLDRPAYTRWHNSSPRKRHFQERMDNHDRAMAAGLEVAPGALLGLADFRYEVLMQVGKARFLGSEHGRKPFVFGAPRLKPIAGADIHTATELSDRAFETALMVYKIAEPSVGRWLQTREAFEMNLANMLDGDVFTYKCGEVRPGGHRTQDASPAAALGSQFAVHDRTREAVESELAGMSFAIDYSWIGEGVCCGKC